MGFFPYWRSSWWFLISNILLHHTFVVLWSQRWSSSPQSFHLQYLREGFSMWRWGKSVTFSHAASHILLWLFVFYWGLITSKVQFQRQPMIHLQVPLSQSLPRPLSSSIFIGAGRPWGTWCWQSPRRRALPVWARRWWGWRCRCLLGRALPPCSKSHIWKKKRERERE